MLRCYAALVLSVAAALCAAGDDGPVLTDDPIIGILSVPIDGAETPCVTIARQQQLSGPSFSCFTSFYVKWLESGGARTVYIPYNADDATLSAILGQVNGVLFTGGGLNLTFGTPYVTTAQKIFDAVQRMNDAGDFFPLYGTCMGMQLLSILAAGDASVLALNAFDAENMSLPLDFLPGAAARSRLFGAAPRGVMDAFAGQNVTENLHHDGVPPAAYYGSAKLRSFFTLVSTNADRRGAAFVSTLEAAAYPIAAAQWHAERPQFEHRQAIGLAHSANATTAMQYVATWFVDQARRSGHAFTNATLLSALAMYARAPVAEGALMDGYQAYILQW